MSTHQIHGQWLTDLNSDLDGSDRSCAVLAGAILDDRVKLLLGAYLLPPRNPSEDRLFGRSGALESFSSRIELSYRLSLITENTRKVLDWVRDIRNDAAHNPAFSYSNDSTKNRVANILETLNLKARGPDLFKAPYKGEKGEFIIAVVVLVGCLELEIKETQHTQHQPTDAVNTVTFSS